MALQNKYEPGEKWILPQGAYIYQHEIPGDRMLFYPEGSLADSGVLPLILPEAELDHLRENRRARRQRQYRDRKGRLQRELGDMPPEGASDKDRARQFYVKKWDQAPCGLGDAGLRRLIQRHATEAKRQGLNWVPSPSTLERAIKNRGEPGRRPIRLMLDMRGRTRRRRQDPLVAEILRRAVAWYYAKDTRNKLDAYAWLIRYTRKVNGIARVRHGAPWRSVLAPSDETLRLRIQCAASLETYTAKWGSDEARRRFQGIERGLSANDILDVVLIDGMTVDGWCVLDDVTRTPAGRPTITLAIDLKSRAVLGVTLTYEGESLSAIIACVQQVITGKHDVIERLPRMKDLVDGLYGKPDTILADNAWRQVGVSFQDACEDEKISVEFAPVKNPPYKAVVERFFLTLKKILFDKMPGGIPVDPVLLRKLGIDPRETAAITLSQLEEFIYEAIYEVYGQEEHSGLGAAPLLVWRKGLAKGREIVDDIDFLAGAFGQVDWATIDRSGINYRGMKFHDPDVTTGLLNDLASTTPIRQQRKRLSSATARVKIKSNPADIRGIWVWNPRKKPQKGYVFLPNWDRQYAEAPGLGFWHHDKICEFAKAENLAFRTDEEKCLARDRLRAHLEAAAPGLKFAAMRTQRRLLEPALPVLTGDTVQMAHAVPSVSGLKEYDIPVSAAAHERADDGFPEKGPRRGGAKAARKAAQTRARKKGLTQAIGHGSGTTAATPFTPTELVVDDPADYMAELARRLAAGEATIDDQ